MTKRKTATILCICVKRRRQVQYGSFLGSRSHQHSVRSLRSPTPRRHRWRWRCHDSRRRSRIRRRERCRVVHRTRREPQPRVLLHDRLRFTDCSDDLSTLFYLRQPSMRIYLDCRRVRWLWRRGRSRRSRSPRGDAPVLVFAREGMALARDDVLRVRMREGWESRSDEVGCAEARRHLGVRFEAGGFALCVACSWGI